MTKEKKATKTTSKAKSVKVKYNQYDTIVNMGPAYDYEVLKDIEVTLMEQEAAEKAAVEKFQSIFGLPVTGVVDYRTWYKISEIYVAVTRIAELV